MLALVPQMRLLVAVEPVDFRRGIDGLAAVCRQRLQADPMSGALFIFRSRNRKSIKILVYDGQGFWLCQKRLSAGRFHWWPRLGDQPTLSLEVQQLQLVLWNGDPEGTPAAPMWRAIAPRG